MFLQFVTLSTLASTTSRTRCQSRAWTQFSNFATTTCPIRPIYHRFERISYGTIFFAKIVVAVQDQNRIFGREKGLWLKFVVVTKLVQAAIDALKTLLDVSRYCRHSIMCCFDIPGSGKTTAFRKAAAENWCLHVWVDLLKCKPLGDQKARCLTEIELECSPSTKSSILERQAKIFEVGTLALLSDIISAVDIALKIHENSGKDSKVRSLDASSSIEVYPENGQGSGNSPEQFSSMPAVNAALDLIATRLEILGIGMLVHLDNAECLLLTENYPSDFDLAAPNYVKFDAKKSGVFLLQSFIHGLRGCLKPIRRIVWALSGLKTNATSSLNIPSDFFPKDISGCTGDLDVEGVKEALRPYASESVLDDPRLMGRLNRLVGPPINTKYFLDVATSSSIDMLLSSWCDFEKLIIDLLRAKFRTDTVTPDVAKFCCIAPLLQYAHMDQFEEAMNVLEFSLAACPFVRLRPDADCPRRYRLNVRRLL